MPRNGSGTQTRLYNWVSDKANSTPVTASRMDAEMDDMTTSLSNSIAKDGQTTITANIPFNSNKITGLTNGSDRTDSIALGQVQDGTYTTLGTAGGSADVYTASPLPLITAYATGSRYIIKIQADNTGASTLNISGVGAKNIKKYNGAGVKVDVEAGDLQQDQYYDIFYDGTDIVVLNPQKPTFDSGNLTAATATANGVIELATQAEVDAGTDTTRAVTPATLKAGLSGHIVQIVNTQTGTVASGSGTIPIDNTIPQNTEGNEFMTLAITPTSASNKLLINVNFIGGEVANLSNHYTVALFQDFTANALASTIGDGFGTGASSVNFTHYMTAGTASSTTFKVRAGLDSGSLYMNGFTGIGQIYGGVAVSSITITEIQV
jgi:hypothetical protein